MPPRTRPALMRALLMATLILGAPQALAQGRAPEAPKSVGIVTAELSDVPQAITLPGRAVAYEVASVRPRVGGLIEAITYQPGQLIEAGTAMFTLETETLDATLEAAKATEQGAILARDNARAVVDRSTALENRGVTRAALEAAQVTLSQAEAAVVTAQAERQSAQLQRDRATIPAPITGYPSETTATIGSLVTADQAEALATVTRLDPIYIDLAASSARILQDRQRVKAGIMTPIEPPKVTLTLDDGSDFGTEGEVTSFGSTVSATTGTVALRVKFANPDRLLLPGQFLRVNMTFGSIKAVMVPQRATSRLADGSLVAFVMKDGKAVRQELTSAGSANNAWAVIAGISAGDQVIVDGLDDLEDGQTVDPVTVTLDDSGVVISPASEGVPWNADSATATPAAGAPSASGASEASPQGWFGKLRAALGLASLQSGTTADRRSQGVQSASADSPAGASTTAGRDGQTAAKVAAAQRAAGQTGQPSATQTGNGRSDAIPTAYGQPDAARPAEAQAGAAQSATAAPAAALPAAALPAAGQAATATPAAARRLINPSGTTRAFIPQPSAEQPSAAPDLQAEAAPATAADAPRG